MTKYLLKISLLASTLLLLFLSMPSYAQQSMKESQKLRIQEEKNRTKLNKQAEKNENKKVKGKSDKSKSKNTKKNKAQVPKAAQKLSAEGERVNQVRTQSRKGNQGLTNAAKIQKKSERKRRKSLQR